MSLTTTDIISIAANDDDDEFDATDSYTEEDETIPYYGEDEPDEVKFIVSSNFLVIFLYSEIFPRISRI